MTKYPDELYAAQTARFMGGRVQCGAGASQPIEQAVRRLGAVAIEAHRIDPSYAEGDREFRSLGGFENSWTLAPQDMPLAN